MGVQTDLREKLISDYAKLSPQMQKAARYILDHPNDVALRSMRALARAANVPPSTVTRLMSAIGVETWRDFRDHYQDRLLDNPASYAQRARETQRTDNDSNRDAHLLESICRTEIDNISAAFSPDFVPHMITACEAIEDARQVFIVGSGAAYPAAFQFAYAYRLFCDNGVLVDGRSGAFGDELRGIGRRDILIAVGAKPYIRDTVRAVEYARSQHCPVIAVTDSDVSPIAVDARTTLVARDTSQSFFQSFTAALSVMQALVALLVARGGPKALQRIAAAEEQLAVFDTYLED
ncbi:MULTISPECIES: MurR/RpiR family transcriptional regulator [Thalassospira]|jgi:DNA-binding MurR/RpiR family transcriptional regulator|uniref:Transcriptional regulator n=1 Tax=Thalassospira profundimaris TaxID=502049 RepID=A0A367VKK3_9PROT|nr:MULTISPECIES: MurR/RpiR family transcriptional regulator [Thalassospira]KZB70660.1 transcriptional regulator [Thalassospira sp. MCCC 1A01148]MBC45562.1 MurR/RpiR family transcriptional regulator [Thalassospira sp.]MBO6805582.1 MurR/RpiR family transcriptional regulator [Thalassospira sp.]MBO6841292.1 MurR/RpiR family transcriptional regulator [Thalassospira sp.]MBS8273737.1 MurR/RpiR family transcriptional regulator [Thalassospira tepidiphila]